MLTLLLAAEAAQPSPIVDLLTSPAVLGGIGSAVAALLGLFVKNAVWRRRIATGAYHAFHIVEDIAAEDESENGIDKAAEALKQLDAWLVANGWRPLKPGEKERAALELKSIAGREVVAQKVAIAAAEAAKPNP